MRALFAVAHESGSGTSRAENFAGFAAVWPLKWEWTRRQSEMHSIEASFRKVSKQTRPLPLPVRARLAIILIPCTTTIAFAANCELLNPLTHEPVHEQVHSPGP